MNIKYIIIFCLYTFLCGCSTQAYFKNINPSKSNQYNYNVDDTQCEAIAQRARAGVPVRTYTPPNGQQPVYGTITGYDNYGNVYHGNYFTVPAGRDNDNFGQEMLEITQSGMALNNAIDVYISTKNSCMQQRGWYRISKEEYDRTLSQQNSNITISKNVPKK